MTHIRTMASYIAEPWTALTVWLRQRAAARQAWVNGHDLDEFVAKLRLASADRAECPVCGHRQALKQDGRLRAHGDSCPGADQLPAPVQLGLLAGAQ